MPNVSVVIALFNKAAYIKRAIESILCQTKLPQEIIVVDDGSTDGGGEIVKQYNDSRIILLRQENQGVSIARNNGVNEAQGELMAFLDADDAWKPRFLEVILHLKQKFPQAGAFATGYEVIDLDGNKIIPQFDALPRGIKEGLLPNYIKASMAAMHTRSVSKKVLLKIGGFPPGERLAQDLDTWLRIALRYPIAWSEELLSTYHQDAENRTAGIKMIDHEPALCRTVRRVIQEDPDSVNNIIDLWEYGAYFQVQSAGYCLWQGKRQQALQLLEYSKGTEFSAQLWRKYHWLALLPAAVPRTYFQTRQVLKKSALLTAAVRRVKQWCGLYQ